VTMSEEAGGCNGQHTRIMCNVQRATDGGRVVVVIC
jgi:hypothetical protein